MGQPQFLPSSYLKYAVDFDGDRRKDIWATHADIFGSIANYLESHGWTGGQRWGRRVSIPSSAGQDLAAASSLRTEGCRAVRDLSNPMPVTEWHRLGVRLPSGARLPASSQPASLLRIQDQTFLVYGNYEALLGYNCAHAYALSVAQLADRLAGR
jgi:membrane-bound lytic murein transglycosylase B